MNNAIETDPLFAPLRLKGTTLENRFVLPAMQRGLHDYRPSARLAQRLEAHAAGGAAIVISEGATPDHPAAYWQPTFAAIGDRTADDWRHVAHSVTNGRETVFLIQLWHPGSVRLVPDDVPNPHRDFPALSPSGLVQAGRVNGMAMTLNEIEETKAAYVRSARIAQEAGAHGVEIHAAHGYLLDQFLWYETNTRKDEYGGPTLVDRARFPAEIVSSIRAATGPDFIISFRFSQFKEVDYSAKIAQTPDELAPFIELIQAAGADMFHVSTRRFDAPAWPEIDETRSTAAWVKQMTDRPVIAIGSVGLSKDWTSDLLNNKQPELQIEADLERVRNGLRAGDFDFIGVGRTQIANTDLVRRVREQDLAGMRKFEKNVDLVDLNMVHEGQLVETEPRT
ncbi:12-oxophytodienoate reductase [Rhodococcus rhodochrous]|uniref:12-oxophytodienoate reductase n=1 Tax=Rhodococcus rhodochrous TaxID=1829 RepID=A0AA46WXF7_RHORH|nr:12-oxophytodienoate reductase [Rhodococcus rhodochrous]UZF45730.1 12-oxophytodienoate reductase [Rhodococcus rhodochrous]